ncbi:hypothetical protein GYMLUDRAFT_931053 [Collybiopsis luxurians FD-317 M1]|nr:hypothetical protein GYMLUDRAFT_931053 [Collybiopsis luxurians FD-317 M1]
MSLILETCSSIFIRLQPLLSSSHFKLRSLFLFTALLHLLLLFLLLTPTYPLLGVFFSFCTPSGAVYALLHRLSGHIPLDRFTRSRASHDTLGALRPHSISGVLLGVLLFSSQSCTKLCEAG